MENGQFIQPTLALIDSENIDLDCHEEIVWSSRTDKDTDDIYLGRLVFATSHSSISLG